MILKQQRMLLINSIAYIYNLNIIILIMECTLIIIDTQFETNVKKIYMFHM